MHYAITWVVKLRGRVTAYTRWETGRQRCRGRRSGSTWGEAGVAKSDRRGFWGGRGGGESGGLVGQNEQKRRRGGGFLEKYMIEAKGKDETENYNYKQKKKNHRLSRSLAFSLLTPSRPSDITWRIKCFSSCGRIFHQETAIENLAKKSC